MDHCTIFPREILHRTERVAVARLEDKSADGTLLGIIARVSSIVLLRRQLPDPGDVQETTFAATETLVVNRESPSCM